MKKIVLLFVVLMLMFSVFSIEVFATDEIPTVVSIEVVEGEPVTEGTGEFRTIEYDYETGTHNSCDGYYYYNYNTFNVNIKIVFSDGTIVYSEGYGFVEYVDDQNKETSYFINASTEQGKDGYEWTVGGENIVTFECEGQTCTYNVTMLESPVKSIEVCEYKTLIENTDGYYVDTVYNEETGVEESSDPYYVYDCDYSNVNLKIIYKDGTIGYSQFVNIDPTHKYYQGIYVSNRSEASYKNRCTVSGEEQITYMYMGKTCTFNVKIAPQTEKVLNPLPRSFYDYRKIIWGVYARGEDGTSQLVTDYTGLIENDFGTWYAVDGIVDFTYHTVVKDPTHGWVAVYRNRYFNTDYTGILGNEYGWWRIVAGKVDFNATGVYENMYGWWYCVDGKVQFDHTGIKRNENGWWRIVNGRVDFKSTGIYQNEYGWWRVVDGKVDFSANGVYKNEYGWWKVEGGKVNFNFTGIASNENGNWYCKDGKVDFTKNGKVTYQGKTYTVRDGKVV